jgi:tRNA/rRNA methyltransferase
LSNEDLDVCQGYIRIPTADYASLNLAHAVQIIAYECFLSRQEAPAAPTEQDLAPRGAVESMYRHLFETLHLIGFTDAMRERIAINYFRDLFDRLQLTTKDVTILRGLWRQVQWAAKDELKRR